MLWLSAWNGDFIANPTDILQFKHMQPFVQHECSLLLIPILRKIKAYRIYAQSMFNIPPINKRMHQVAVSYIRDSELQFFILASSFSYVIYALSQSSSYSKALPAHFLMNAGLYNAGLSGVSKRFIFLYAFLGIHIVEWIANRIHFISWLMIMFSLLIETNISEENAISILNLPEENAFLLIVVNALLQVVVI
jgi:hypothetical protein